MSGDRTSIAAHVLELGRALLERQFGADAVEELVAEATGLEPDRARLEAARARAELHAPRRKIAAADVATPAPRLGRSEVDARDRKRATGRALEARARGQRASSRARRRRIRRDRGAAARAHLEAYRAKLQRLGQRDACPVGVTRDQWSMCELAMRDGRGARLVIAQLPAALRDAFVEHVLGVNAEGIERAWCPLRWDPDRDRWQRTKPTLVRHWDDPVVRKWAAILAFAWWGSRYDRARRGFSHVTTGYSRGRIAATIRKPLGRDASKYSRSAITNVVDGIPALLRELGDDAGVSTVQPPHRSHFEHDPIPSSDRGPSGYAFAQWWFAARGTKGLRGLRAINTGLPGAPAHVAGELLGFDEGDVAELELEARPETPADVSAADGLARELARALTPPRARAAADPPPPL